MKFSWLLLNFLFAICVLFFCLRLIIVLQRAQLGSYVTQSIFVFSTCHTLPDWRLSYLLSWSNFMSCYDLPQNKRSLFANLNKAARRSQPSSLWYNVAGVLLYRFYCSHIWGPRYCSCYSIISFMTLIIILNTQNLTLLCPPASRAQLSCNMETQAPTNTIDQPSPSHLSFSLLKTLGPITGAVQPPKESWSSQKPSKPVPGSVLPQVKFFNLNQGPPELLDPSSTQGFISPCSFHPAVCPPSSPNQSKLSSAKGNDF